MKPMIKRLQRESVAQMEAKRRKDEVERRNRRKHQMLCGTNGLRMPCIERLDLM